jgi:hypothetical protein
MMMIDTPLNQGISLGGLHLLRLTTTSTGCVDASANGYIVAAAYAKAGGALPLAHTER